MVAGVLIGPCQGFHPRAGDHHRNSPIAVRSEGHDTAVRITPSRASSNRRCHPTPSGGVGCGSREASQRKLSAKDTSKVGEEVSEAAKTGDVKSALIAGTEIDASAINVDTISETKTVVLRGSVADGGDERTSGDDRSAQFARVHGSESARRCSALMTRMLAHPASRAAGQNLETEVGEQCSVSSRGLFRESSSERWRS